MTCPDCERHKLSAALWRHKAYELNGTPLPWSAEEMIKEAVLAEREACAKVCEDMDLRNRQLRPEYQIGLDNAVRAIRARGQA